MDRTVAGGTYDRPRKENRRRAAGATGTGTRYVFAISTAAAIVALFAIAFVFFGAPDMGLDDARSGADATPPYDLPDGDARLAGARPGRESVQPSAP